MKCQRMILWSVFPREGNDLQQLLIDAWVFIIMSGSCLLLLGSPLSVRVCCHSPSQEGTGFIEC